MPERVMRFNGAICAEAARATYSETLHDTLDMLLTRMGDGRERGSTLEWVRTADGSIFLGVNLNNIASVSAYDLLQAQYEHDMGEVADEGYTIASYGRNPTGGGTWTTVGGQWTIVLDEPQREPQVEEPEDGTW